MDGQMMSEPMMMACMIASALFALIVLITLVVQAILQAKILRELRRLRVDTPQLAQKTTAEP